MQFCTHIFHCRKVNSSMSLHVLMMTKINQQPLILWKDRLLHHQECNHGVEQWPPHYVHILVWHKFITLGLSTKILGSSTKRKPLIMLLTPSSELNSKGCKGIYRIKGNSKVLATIKSLRILRGHLDPTTRTTHLKVLYIDFGGLLSVDLGLDLWSFSKLFELLVYELGLTWSKTPQFLPMALNINWGYVAQREKSQKHLNSKGFLLGPSLLPFVPLFGWLRGLLHLLYPLWIAASVLARGNLPCTLLLEH